MAPPGCKSHVRSVRKRSTTCKYVEELLPMNDEVESGGLCRCRWRNDGIAAACAALAFVAEGSEEACPSIALSGGPAEKLAPAIKTSEV